MNFNGNEKDLEKSVKRAFDMEDGKTVLVKIGDLHLRADYRCMGKEDEDTCPACKLRFNCFAYQYLIIDAEQLDLANIDHTINEQVQAFIESKKKKKD